MWTKSVRAHYCREGTNPSMRGPFPGPKYLPLDPTSSTGDRILTWDFGGTNIQTILKINFRNTLTTPRSLSIAMWCGPWPHLPLHLPLSPPLPFGWGHSPFLLVPSWTAAQINPPQFPVVHGTHFIHVSLTHPFPRIILGVWDTWWHYLPIQSSLSTYNSSASLLFFSCVRGDSDSRSLWPPIYSPMGSSFLLPRKKSQCTDISSSCSREKI